ncbi:c-type cytochrome biogenesis protein CcmI [Limibaculum sp. M0105]|uniref:C-type cytochrome biogenesis protein CcmI n=1 Tax=Thermohalobaculum xanthum TaxID=2753746 RepID=A0A8J7SEH2_9RHOB|nr:c-type cytochrome biogenesis protein CcmI [Thermohalobaculum xanthum]MBK0398952.1 c-type cytochrome biogenesis protein CcmI [Thermohalobaculum xanthum]
MSMFLIVAGALAVLAAAVIAYPLLRGGASAESRDAADARVFRDQLDELERDLARGVISSAEADGARAEVSRRLLRAADRASRGASDRQAPRTVTGLVAGLTLLAAPVVGGVVYMSVGAPGMRDIPLSTRDAAADRVARPSQSEAEAQFADVPRPDAPQVPDEYRALIVRLEKIIEERPDDPEGNRLLANAYMQMQRYAEAWRVMAHLVELRGAAAPAELYGAQAEAMVLAARGYVSPEAETVIAQTLERDPAQPMARYYSGLALAQAGQIDAAIGTWQTMLNEAPEDAEWRGFVGEMLAEAIRVRDGASAEQPPFAGPNPSGTSPGPASADIAAAAEMSDEDRAAMIEGMVGQLEQRLEGEGGEPEEFLRLINAYRVLGRADDARRAFDLSQRKLQGSEASFVREQALVMGLITE